MRQGERGRGGAASHEALACRTALGALIFALALPQNPAAGAPVEAAQAEVVWQQVGGKRRKPAVAGTYVRTWRRGDIVEAVAFGPSGSRVLTGSSDGTAVLRDVATRRNLQTWRHKGSVSAVALSPNGAVVLTGSFDGTAVLRDVATGRDLHTWRHGKPVLAVAFSPDGTKVLTGSTDDTAVLRDVATRRDLHTWRHGDSVRAVAFSPNGAQVLTGSFDRTAVLRDVATGRELHSWRHGDWVQAVAFGPDGTLVLTGSNDSTAVLRDVVSGRSVHTWRHVAPVVAVAFSLDGTEVLTGSGGDKPMLRDVATGQDLQGWRQDDWFAALVSSAGRARGLTVSSGDDIAALQSASPPSERLRFPERFQLGTKRVLEGLRKLPASLASRREELSHARPAETGALQKDEFESSAAFQARVRDTQAQHTRAVEAYNRALAELERDIHAFWRSVPSRLSNSQLARAASEAMVDSFGYPALANVRYDADTETFFADLEPAAAGELGIPRTLVVSRKIPNAQARAFKTALASARPRVVFTITAEGRLTYQGTSVEIGKERYSLLPTAAGFVPQAVTAQVPVLAAPRELTTAGGSGLQPVAVQPVSVVGADPEVARLQAEVWERERQKAQKEAEAARKAELLARKRALDEEMRQAEAASGGADDLGPLLRKEALRPADPHRYLLAIGLRSYAEAPHVSFGDSAADLLAEFAARRLGVPEQNLVRLSNERATGTAIKGKLKTLLNRLRPGDTFYLYYAGHGVPARGGAATYLLPHDGVEGAYEDPELRLDALYARLEATKASRIVVILDACFSGRTGPREQLFKGVAPMQLAARPGAVDPKRMTVLVAGEGNQFANEYRERSNRLFTYFLVKGLLEGKTALGDLYPYVRGRVDEQSRRKGLDYTQTPQLFGKPDGNL